MCVDQIRRFQTTVFLILVQSIVVSPALAIEPLLGPRWALDNDEYAQLYNGPYSTDPTQRRSQIFREALDARFQEGNEGWYVGSGAAMNHRSGGQIEVGKFQLPTAWSTMRFGAIGTLVDGHTMGGGEFGLRLHTPTRLAPFVGVTGVLEINGFNRHSSYNRYYYNNGIRYNNPRWGYYPTGMVAIVPEAGVSYWLNTSTRLNVGASYYVTSGHYPDFLLLGVSVDFARGRPPVEPISLPPDVYDGTEPDPYFVPDGPFLPADDLPTLDAVPPTPDALNPLQYEEFVPDSKPSESLPPMLSQAFALRCSH